MKMLFRSLGFLTVIISLSSCFDFLEEITMNEDGSGLYITSLDATVMAKQVEAMSSLDSTGDMASGFKYSMDSSLLETVRKYKSVRGISNVKIDTSKPNIYKISMNFDNVEALNKGIFLEKNDEGAKNLYTWEKGKLTRKDNKLNFGEMDDEEMITTFMSESKYTIVFNLPGKIKSAKNDDAKISGDKRSVTLICGIVDLFDYKSNLGIDINYK